MCLVEAAVSHEVPTELSGTVCRHLLGKKWERATAAQAEGPRPQRLSREEACGSSTRCPQCPGIAASLLRVWSAEPATRLTGKFNRSDASGAYLVPLKRGSGARHFQQVHRRMHSEIWDLLG